MFGIESYITCDKAPKSPYTAVRLEVLQIVRRSLPISPVKAQRLLKTVGGPLRI